MNDLINKISSYNLFNYLFPGVLFVVLLDKATNFHFLQENVLEGVFLYYFIGMLINRVGSLCIEPILRKTKLVVFKPLKDFNKAKALDSKIEIHSETNNMFRSVAAMFLVLSVFIGFDMTGIQFDWNAGFAKLAIVLALFVFLILSYRKQTKIIYDRVDTALSSEKDKS